MRSAAALLYSSTGNFDTVCVSSTDSGKQFLSAFEQSKKVTNEAMCLESDTNAWGSLSGVITLYGKTATVDKWAVYMRLPNSGNYFCVDSSGIAREQVSANLNNGPTDVDCN